MCMEAVGADEFQGGGVLALGLGGVALQVVEGGEGEQGKGFAAGFGAAFEEGGGFFVMGEGGGEVHVLFFDLAHAPLYEAQVGPVGEGRVKLVSADIDGVGVLE